MALTKVLVTVKTYPCLSAKYDELVCTAGFREDGTWIRIYPVPFRKLAQYQQYNKYDWIEIDVTKNTKDLRPESFRPVDFSKEIKVVDHVDTGKKRDWKRRRDLVLQNVYTDMTTLLRDCKEKEVSLAVMKATITDFKISPTEREWDAEKLAIIKANQDQLDLFGQKEVFEVVKKIPYKFSYQFTTDDEKSRTLMIEDWELGMLYFNSLVLPDVKGDEKKACDKVKEMYFDNFACKRDLYLFLGTSLKWQQRNVENPFMVIGTFYPPFLNEEPTLF